MKTYSRKKSGEAQDVILDLNELCRLCMAKEDELVPIFNNDEAIPLTLRIMACVSLEVINHGYLPTDIYPFFKLFNKITLFDGPENEANSEFFLVGAVA